MVERSMFDLDIMVTAFEKVAATKNRFTVAQMRKGRRSMRVDTMLRKDREGTLYKKAELDFPKCADLKQSFTFGGAPEAWWLGFDDELEKMGEDPNQVKWWEARRALNSYKKLQEEAPDPQNVAAYAATGAVISPAMLALKAPIEGRAPETAGAKAFQEWQQARFGKQTPVPKARGPVTVRNAPRRALDATRRATLGGSTTRKYLASSLGGAAFMGAMPFVRHGVDKYMQKRKLQKYLQQQQNQGGTNE